MNEECKNYFEKILKALPITRIIDVPLRKDGEIIEVGKRYYIEISTSIFPNNIDRFKNKDRIFNLIVNRLKNNLYEILDDLEEIK